MQEREIFIEALRRQNESARSAYLHEACGDNTQLRRSVEELLADQANDESCFLDHPVALGTIDYTWWAAPCVGAQIGPYKLREQIGEGGMGAVYVAEQTDPIRRKVALKIIRPGIASRDAVARFEVERQALAMMDHPHIAKLLDAGTMGVPRKCHTDDSNRDEARGVAVSEVAQSSVPRSRPDYSGQPYFVMELVQGLPITEYCDQHKLGTNERLELFETVCRAIQHAHQMGIIHRDIKPSNILVPEIDGKAVPKIIDFGVAKAVGHSLTEQTPYTAFAQMVGTPLYMSPEQAALGVVDVDTRSDIYSLGVLLYELLTGTTPFDSNTLMNASFDEMRRIIREDDPPSLSARVNTLKGEELSTICQRRRCDPRKLSDSLSGELDWLVMKALEKDRNRRYESASALATDVHRYLRDEPIAAKPPSIVYRWKKYAWRNRRPLATASLAAALTLTGVTWAIISTVNDKQVLRSVAQDVERSLTGARAFIDTGDLAAAREYVGQAHGRLSGFEDRRPQLALAVAKLNQEINHRVAQQDRFHTVQRLAEQAVHEMSYDQDLGGEIRALEALQLYDVLGDKENLTERLSGSYLSAADVQEVRRTIFELLVSLADFGVRWPKVCSKQDATSSLDYLERAAVISTPTPAWYWVRSECHRLLEDAEAAQDDLERYRTMEARTALDYYLPGHTLAWRGDKDGALRAYEAALDIEPNHFNSLFFLAFRLQPLGRHQEAAHVFRACLALKPDHVPSLRNRALSLSELERFDEAINSVNKALELSNSEVEWTVRATVYMKQGKLDEAIADFSRAIEASPQSSTAYQNRGVLYLQKRQYEEAIADFDRAASLAPEAADVYDLRCGCYYELHQYERALVDVERAIKLKPSVAHYHTHHAWCHVVLKSYDTAVASFTKATELSPRDFLPYQQHAQFRVICPDSAYHEPKEALSLAQKAVELAPDNGDSWAVLGMAQTRAGEPQAALESMRKAQELRASEDEYLLLFRSMIHAQLGQRQEAQQWYDRAVQWMKNHNEGDEINIGVQMEVEALLKTWPPATESGREPMDAK